MKTTEKSCFYRKVGAGVIVLFLLHSFIFSQSCYNPFVETIIQGVSEQSITKIVHELTGDTSTIIGGVPYTILTRAYNYPGNQKAAQYIFEKFASYGYSPRYQTFSLTGNNVIAVKTGVKYPNKHYIICGHYDSYPWEERSIGADDDATGTCGVIEAARILAPYNFDYTIIFLAVDEEEIGLYGSGAYADTAVFKNDSIMAVINLDMTAYDANHDSKLDVITNNQSIYFANVYSSSCLIYQPALIPFIAVRPLAASDHYSFWERGYKAIWPWENDINPYVNSMMDTISRFNYDYFLKMTRAAVAALVVLGRDYIINFNHDPLLSTADSTGRTATVVITSNHKLGMYSPGKIPNDPKLYYKVGNGLFHYLRASYHHLDTFKYIIPGQPVGSTVSYYLTAQDSAGTMVGSLPAGARGVNPPGTTPPQQLFVYRILKQSNYCSGSVPKSIPPRQIVYDTIHISQEGNIFDYNLNLTIYHTHDSSLYLWLTRPGASMVILSRANGGSGENYFNTTFDDEATIPITEGVPPFIGSYRPETPLNAMDNIPMQGDWLLRIFNYSETITGQLANWCLSFEHYDPIGIVNNQVPVKASLSQNYPNPFNSATKINFSLPKQSHVKISIYDILGREVNVPVNGVMNYGEHNIDFEASNLASGMYFYSMYLNGSLFETKKMVLVK